MIFKIRWVFIFIFICFDSILIGHSYPYYELCASVPIDSDLKILETLNGKIQGECYTVPVKKSDDTIIKNDVFSFLSVPYALPPIAENRFKRPLPVNSWQEILDGKKWPNSCMQIVGPINSDIANLSEDCLYLNVFVPSKVFLNKDRIHDTPILVFIHGGGLTIGSSVSDWYEPSTLVSLSEIIVITINYRLDYLGLLYLEDTDATGNQALLDQTLALEWIYENAHTFGGDKNKITVSGESAGAISIGFHLFYPKSWPYFRNAIMQSGTPLMKCKFWINNFLLPLKLII